MENRRSAGLCLQFRVYPSSANRPRLNTTREVIQSRPVVPSVRSPQSTLKGQGR